MKKLSLSNVVLAGENMLKAEEKKQIQGGSRCECICMSGNYPAPCNVSCADEWCLQFD